MADKENILEDLMKQVPNLVPVLNNNEEQNLDWLGVLLTMPDNEFNIMKDLILAELEKSLNNSNTQLLISQALNVSGTKSEDFVNMYSEICNHLDKQLQGNFSKTKIDFIKQMLGVFVNSVSETEGIAKRVIQIPIELCHKNAKIPTYANPTDAGLDIYALEDITIHPGETKLIPTGIKVAIPIGYELQVRAKSGISLKTKLRLGNGIGTIDSGYRGEIGLIIDNIEPPIKDITYESKLIDNKPVYTITSILHGSDMVFTKGQKIAQLVLSEVPRASFYKVDNIEEIEGDRGGGFGSTDTK